MAKPLRITITAETNDLTYGMAAEVCKCLNTRFPRVRACVYTPTSRAYHVEIDGERADVLAAFNALDGQLAEIQSANAIE